MACLVGLARYRNAPDIIMMAGLTAMLSLDIVQIDSGLAGFSNEGMLTIAGLYVLVAGLRETGIVDRIGVIALGQPSGTKRSMLRMFVPVAGSSAVVNNTPIVAVFIPAVMDWCKRHSLSPRMFLMPLSFIAIAGGTCSLLGSATNVIANGLLVDAAGDGLGLFQTAFVGIPLLLMTALYLCVAAPVILKSTPQLPRDEAHLGAQFYATEFVVSEDSEIVGKSVERAGLRHLAGVYLAEIVRGTERLSAVGPATIIAAGDRLEFVGDATRIADLQRIRGLVHSDAGAAAVSQQHWYEAVVSSQSGFVDQRIRDCEFRTVTGAVIVGVRRGGKRLSGRKIGDIVLQSGDTLLLSASRPLRPSVTAGHFLLVREVGVYHPARSRRGTLAAAVFVAVVGSAAVGAIPLLAATWIGAGLMLALRCVTPQAARRAVDYRVLVVIAAAIGVGNGLVESGCADAISQWLLASTATGEVSTTFAVGVIFALTCLLSSAITNSAAVIILFPIALEYGTTAGLSPVAVTVTLIVGASASFVTAIAYQTNLMVQGIGRYSAMDFAKLGLPLVCLFWVAAVALVPHVY
nr:SLC13 family permease [Oceanococcus sp. HetDA_MAG_MS8]